MRHLFLCIPQQSGYNKRLRAAGPLMWCLANPKLGEREVMTALVRPARRHSSDPASTPTERKLLRIPQWIEAIFDTLKGQLSLERHGARTHGGIFARIGQRLLAMAAAIRHNTKTGATSKRSLITYDY